MGEALSQAEIDKLINNVSSDNDLENNGQRNNNIINYNFSRPSKFSKEQLRTLEIIFDSYGRSLTTFLTGYLRSNVEIEVINSEQITYKDFSLSLANPTIMCLADFEPLKGRIIMELSSSIGFVIIDRILGGKGEPPSELRDFSDIEKVLLERLFVQILNLMPDAWESVLNIDPRFSMLETNVQFAQVLPPNEITALVTLNIRLGEISGYLNICLPHIVIEPVSSKLSTTNWFSQSIQTSASEYKDDIENKLENTYIDISAVIGKTNIMVSDFLSLQVGDLIHLDSYINSGLDIMVGDLLKFTGNPGISRGKNAIQITQLVGKEEQ